MSRAQHKGRDARGRFRKTDEDLGRFGWLVGATIVLELGLLLWITGGIRPL